MDRKKTLDWITWIVNMLVALPFMGLLSCFVVWLVLAVLDVCSLYINLPHKIWIVVVLGIFLTVIWGQYQYDILIRKNVRLTSKRGWKSLCILAGVVILAFLLLVGIPAYLKSRQCAKYNEALRRHRESRDKQAEQIESPDRPQEEKRTEE
ncbi:MAG: hypothetical protein J5898_00135 [Lachnospiraceae bacterium]|nr:hypothetical protein [Lachnospiraceae bacterium]